MKQTEELVLLAKRIQALSENGQHFAVNDFDLDRYKQVDEISRKMLGILTQTDKLFIDSFLPENNGYKTPKVDVRAVVFSRKNEILMVREKIDGKWSLPGGWADIGFTPAEVAVKETMEEAGMKVKPSRILAVLDKKCYDHPVDFFYAYKIFIECYPLDDNLETGFETTDAAFFSIDNLPELSLPRNTEEQIRIMFKFNNGAFSWPLID